jgi:hypothetical protein
MQRVGFGHLRLVVDEPRPQVAVAGGDGGDGPQIAGWTIVEGAITRIAGQRRIVEIAGWRSARFVQGDNGLYQVTPDWLCEPAEIDPTAQLARYVGQGIGHVWLIDPSTRTIDVYRYASGAYSHVTTSQGNARLRAEPFSAFDLDLTSVWSDTNE